MNLRATLRSGVAAICVAGLAAPTGMAAPVRSAPQGRTDAKTPKAAVLRVGVAQARDFTRLDFFWPGGARPAFKRDGQVLTFSFNRDAAAEIAVLKASPPRWLKAAEAKHDGGRLQLLLTLADDADVKLGEDGGQPFALLSARPLAAAPAASGPQQPSGPAPAGGLVKVRSETAGLSTRLVFEWPRATPAAVFRRGEAFWIVFAAPARLDISAAAPRTGQYAALRTLEGPGYTALRVAAPTNVVAQAVGQGARWVVSLGPDRDGADPIVVSRDQESAKPALRAGLAGAGQPLWVDDPVVGDRMAVAPALAPAKGLASRREFVEFALLQSAQGLAIEPYASDLQLNVQGDLVRIERPKGLALSAASERAMELDAASGAPQPAAMPALLDDSWGRVKSGGFTARYTALFEAASQETGRLKTAGKEAPVAARMALARFLIGSGLNYEAIGVLNTAARARQSLMGDPEFRGLRGMARMLVGRYAEAEADLSAPVLSEEPSAALWRAYGAVRTGDYANARKLFQDGTAAFDHFSPMWKARFATADAEAALALGDVAGAKDSIAVALREPLKAEEQLKVRLVQAKMFEAAGDKPRALAVFRAVATAPLDQLAAPALMHATNLELEFGKTTPERAAQVLDQLRYRWRGDATELETVRALGALYLHQGRYREALDALRSAGRQQSDRPEARALQNDLATAFRDLFLDGMADGLQPIQALALFYDFKDLTPIGADGDMMVRNMVRRLVDVDLLDQAADLLKYQVDNRLDGVAKAQVATDLAVINLMNHKPEDALDAINASRTTILPTAMNADRRLVTARAYMALGRIDAGLEIIEGDKSREAQDIRADAAWRQKDWSQAAVQMEKILGERWRSPLPLAPDEEGLLLRTGVAYSLSGDGAALTRLRERFGGLIEKSAAADSLRVALAGPESEAISPADFGRIAAEGDSFSGWVGRMKNRFRQAAAPPPAKPGAKAA